MSLTPAILAYIEEGQGDFNQLALEVFAYQFENCLPYQVFCQRQGKTPATVKHWQEVPAVSTDVFREVDLSTMPLEKALYVFHTSGTSQEKKGRHYYHDFTLYDAAVKNSFLEGIGLAPFTQSYYRVLTPSFKEIQTSSLYYMFGQVLSWWGESGSRFYMKGNELDYEKLYQDLVIDGEKARPVVLLGTAFSWVNFLDYLSEQNKSLALPQGSRILETGGLKGRSRSVTREELYQGFVERLGLALDHCYSEYGMTELSSQCYSKPNSHCFYSPPWMPVTLINPETGEKAAPGEEGLVQFFDLANLTAISAVLTSDLARPVGDHFELLGRAPKAVLRGCSTAFEN